MTNVTSDIITSKVSIYNILFGKKTAEPSIIVAAEKLVINLSKVQNASLQS